MPHAAGPDSPRNVPATSAENPPPPAFCLNALDALLPYGLWVCDGDGAVEYLSPGFLALLGKGLSQCRQEGWTGLLPSDERAVALEKWSRCLRKGEFWEHRYRVRDGEGRYRHVLSRGAPVREEGDVIRAWVGINLDVTTMMEAAETAGKSEERRRKAQRLEVIGRLAGGVAHDFNNLLTAINGYSELVLSQLGEDHPLGDHIREIRRAGEKAATLTRQLLAFSRRQTLAPKVLNLNTVVRDAWKSLGRFLGEGIEMEFRPDLSLARMQADPVQVEQVLFTVALNAREAMPQGGRLVVETANAELPPGEAAFDSTDAAASRGPFVLLTVQDCGDGMDEETLSHLFEPFYSTKGRAQGLGLPAVYGIVKQSGGYISVSSQKGSGSILRVYWPTVEEPPAPVPDP
jgi:two-component system, cell cycle sensor histidine kinase and response regulator CckA